MHYSCGMEKVCRVCFILPFHCEMKLKQEEKKNQLLSLKHAELILLSSQILLVYSMFNFIFIFVRCLLSIYHTCVSISLILELWEWNRVEYTYKFLHVFFLVSSFFNFFFCLDSTRKKNFFSFMFNVRLFFTSDT